MNLTMKIETVGKGVLRDNNGTYTKGGGGLGSLPKDHALELRHFGRSELWVS